MAGGIPRKIGRGPLRASELREGYYELSDGHPVECAPAGGRGGRATLVGGAVLESDPAVESAGVDVGFTPDEGTMRAPDVSVGNVPDRPGWAQGAPPLAVEYADSGQDEVELGKKIAELLAAGTRWVWVVRLVGPRRVEVYQAASPMRLVGPGEMLEAPAVLRNAVPVEALYDASAAHAHVLRNLLQRRGYDGLDAVRDEGRLEQARAIVRRVLLRRGLAMTIEQDELLSACTDLERLEQMLDTALTASSADDVVR